MMRELTSWVRFRVLNQKATIFEVNSSSESLSVKSLIRMSPSLMCGFGTLLKWGAVLGGEGGDRPKRANRFAHLSVPPSPSPPSVTFAVIFESSFMATLSIKIQLTMYLFQRREAKLCQWPLASFQEIEFYSSLWQPPGESLHERVHCACQPKASLKGGVTRVHHLFTSLANFNRALTITEILFRQPLDKSGEWN